MCGQVETTYHIIFRCALAQFTWCLYQDLWVTLLPNQCREFPRAVIRESRPEYQKVPNVSVWLGGVFPCYIFYAEMGGAGQEGRHGQGLDMVVVAQARQKLVLRVSSWRRDGGWRVLRYPFLISIFLEGAKYTPFVISLFTWQKKL